MKKKRSSIDDLEKITLTDFKKIMPIPIPSCAKCGTQMKLKEKDGSKFWGCPRWATCGGKTVKYEGVDNPSPNAPQSPTTNQNKVNGDLLLLESINALTAKIDELIDVMRSNL